MRVGAVLGHDEVGPERRRQVRDEPPDGAQPRVGAGERLERHVDDGAGRGPLPDLVGIARAGEEVATGLVQRQGQHARIGPRGSPGRRHRGGRRGPCTGPADRRAGHGRSPGPDRRRCRTPTPGPAWRDGARRRGGTRARCRRAGSPRRPATTRRPPRRLPRASRRTPDRRPPDRSRRAGTERVAREPLDGLDVGGSCGTTRAHHQGPAPGRGPAPPRPIATGRSPARTAAASADGPARSRSRWTEARTRGACAARYPAADGSATNARPFYPSPRSIGHRPASRSRP